MKNSNLVFKQIEHNSHLYREAVALRSKVLREPLNMRFTEKQLQSEHPYIHLAAFYQNKIVSCLYIIRDNEKARLKQFVVEPELQDQGIGREMMQFMETYCLKKGIKYIYMHAREYAVPFYEKLGYHKYGERFLEIGLPHWKLEKWL